MMDYGIIVPMNGRNYPDRCKIAAKLLQNCKKTLPERVFISRCVC